MRFSKGQKVRIMKTRPKDAEWCSDPGWNSAMDRHLGTQDIIHEICSSSKDWYKLEGNSWTWKADWLLPTSLIEKDTVKIIQGEYKEKLGQVSGYYYSDIIVLVEGRNIIFKETYLELIGRKNLL